MNLSQTFGLFTALLFAVSLCGAQTVVAESSDAFLTKEDVLSTGHSESVNFAAISPDGTQVASASDDGHVELRALSDGALVASFQVTADKQRWQGSPEEDFVDGMGQDIAGLRWCLGGPCFLVVTKSGDLKVFDTNSGSVAHSAQLDHTVSVVDVDQAGNRLLVGSIMGGVASYSIVPTALVATYRPEGGFRYATTVDFSADGTLALSALYNYDPTEDVALNPGSGTVANAGLVAWDRSTQTVSQRYPQMTGSVEAWFEGSVVVAMGKEPGSGSVIDRASGATLHSGTQFKPNLRKVKVGSVVKFYCSGGGQLNVYELDDTTNAISQVLSFKVGPQEGFAWGSGNKSREVAGGGLLVGTDGEQNLVLYKIHEVSLGSPSAMPDSTVIGSIDGVPLSTTHRLTSGGLSGVGSGRGAGGPVAAEASPDGQWLAVVGDEGAVALWHDTLDTPGGTLSGSILAGISIYPSGEPRSHRGQLLSFSVDSQRLYIRSAPGTTVWRVDLPSASVTNLGPVKDANGNTIVLAWMQEMVPSQIVMGRRSTIDVSVHAADLTLDRILISSTDLNKNVVNGFISLGGGDFAALPDAWVPSTHPFSDMSHSNFQPSVFHTNSDPWTMTATGSLEYTGARFAATNGGSRLLMKKGVTQYRLLSIDGSGNLSTVASVREDRVFQGGDMPHIDDDIALAWNVRNLYWIDTGGSSLEGKEALSSLSASPLRWIADVVGCPSKHAAYVFSRSGTIFRIHLGS